MIDEHPAKDGEKWALALALALRATRLRNYDRELHNKTDSERCAKTYFGVHPSRSFNPIYPTTAQRHKIRLRLRPAASPVRPDTESTS